MTAPSFAQLAHETSRRREVVAEYRGAVADLMLARIAAFGADPDFQDLAYELAELLEISVEEAAVELLLVTTAIYRAAAAAGAPAPHRSEAA